jgi:predicted Zn-dependent peptidase
MELQVHTLPNGIRLVHAFVATKVAHCGVFTNAGTRDETASQHGIAHFIEHVIFKGTETRNVFQVLNRLENVGADLNAYTTKEEICIYATFLPVYYQRTLELISDICFHSTFPEKEINKEKDVVIDEIKSYQDTPGEQIFDDFEDLVFEGHPLGKNILGTPKNVKRFTREDLRKFISENYHSDQIVISSVGNIEMKKLVSLVEKYFSEVPVNRRNFERKPFSVYHPVNRLQKRKIFQSHCIVGAPAYSMTDPKRYVLAFLNNILGGPILNSRLSIALREKNGITYHIESNFIPYSDSGIFSVYFGTNREMVEKAFMLVRKEIDKLRQQQLGTNQLQIAKRQLIGQITIAQESKLNQMLAIGKSYLVMNSYTGLDETIQIIENITSGQLMEAANEILSTERLSSLIFQS